MIYGREEIPLSHLWLCFFLDSSRAAVLGQTATQKNFVVVPSRNVGDVGSDVMGRLGRPPPQLKWVSRGRSAVSGTASGVARWWMTLHRSLKAVTLAWMLRIFSRELWRTEREPNADGDGKARGQCEDGSRRKEWRERCVCEREVVRKMKRMKI